MTTRVFLLCQAATAATRTGVFGSDAAIEPGERDRIARLALPRAATVLTAPSRAARETADALDLAPSTDDRLADIDTGRWQGRTFATVLAEEPEAVARWMADPSSAPHGGESLAELVARAGRWLEAMAHDRRVVAVTHAAVMRAAVVHVLGAPAQAFWSVDAAPLSIVAFSHDGRRWRLRYDGP